MRILLESIDANHPDSKRLRKIQELEADLYFALHDQEAFMHLYSSSLWNTEARMQRPKGFAQDYQLLQWLDKMKELQQKSESNAAHS
jgi:hypothetical protein